METYNRNHFLYVLDNVFSILTKVFLPLLILAFGKLGAEESVFMRFGLIAVLALLLLIVIFAYSVLKWLKTVYYIKDNFIVYREGIFVVKQREIPFNKIQTINISQNIKQRVFSVASLKIDTGSSSYGNSEISVVIGKVEAEMLRQEIMYSKEQGVTGTAAYGILSPEILNSSKQFVISNKELFIMGLTSNAVFAGLAFIGSLYTFLNDFLESLLEDAIRRFDILINIFDFKSKSMYSIILTIVTMVFIFIIFSFIASIIGTYIKYYGFNVKREGKNIIINYGLLEKKNYVLPKAKIKAVYIRQNLLRQMFGLSVINVESIGYGNEKGEEAILYPIVGKEKQVAVIKELLPEFLFEERMIRVPKSTVSRFVISAALLPSIISVVLSFVFKYGFISLFALPFFVLKGFLEYRNSAVAKTDRLLCMSSHAFTKSVAVVAIRDIQSSSESSNYFQRRKGLFNYEISIHSNTFGKMIKVRNLDESLKDRFLRLVIDNK